MRVGLPLMKKLLALLAKSVFILLRLTAAASAIDTAIKKILDWACVFETLSTTNSTNNLKWRDGGY